MPGFKEAVLAKRNEEQIGKILTYLAGKARAQGTRTACPDEEELATYLSGGLGQPAREELESHLAACTACLDDVTAAHASIPGSEKEAVPQRLLEHAIALVPAVSEEPNIFDLVVRLVLNSIQLVSTSGELVPATAPAGIRGKLKSSATAIVQIEKEVGKFKVGVEVERVEGDLCQVAVTVNARGMSIDDGIRVSLLSGRREQASYLTRQGTAIFDRVLPGEYRLAVSQLGRHIGSMRLAIKEAHHE